jgi:hypothetical protein
MSDQALIEQLKQALQLAREALSHTATDLMHENFDAEESDTEVDVGNNGWLVLGRLITALSSLMKVASGLRSEVGDTSFD